MSHQLRYAYNTNGCANHRLEDALCLIREAGYDGVALTLDWHHLDPFARDWRHQTLKVRNFLKIYELDSVIETGALFLLDSRQKHEPTLINPYKIGRRKRLEFLKRAIDIAAMLESEAVSFWAGVRQPQVSNEQARQYLIDGLNELTEYAASKQVTLSMEPVPGMEIETVTQLLELNNDLKRPLPLTLDVGHVWVSGETEPAEAVRTFGPQCGTVAIEGMDKGRHVHLPLTEGDMDIEKILRAFMEIKFDKMICVEIPRESPRAHQAISESLQALKAMEQTAAQKLTLS